MTSRQNPIPAIPHLSGCRTWMAVAWAMVLQATTGWATHNRAGEITYTHVQGLTYEVVITTYTKSDALADRPFLFLRWGDETGNDLDSLARELPVGQLGGNVQMNTYRGTHTYGGPGMYELSVEDPNRNEGVLNMVGSVDTPFAIRSLLIIDPQAGHNNSVQLLNPATENACLNQPWIHNPAAHDPDGDVLTYSLVPCRGFNGDPIPTYVFPDEVSPGEDEFTIDQETGDLTWTTPQLVGEYNVAIRIEEWRPVNGTLRKVGEVVRDIQIDVQLCANQPPEVVPMADTCVLAGTNLTFDVLASDPDNHPVTMTAVGGALTEVDHPADFAYWGNGLGTFTWSPTCTEVRAEPHQVVFKAKDLASPIPLSDLETRQITVVSPPVGEVAVSPEGYTLQITWAPTLCLDALPTPQVSGGSYEVHRRLALDETDWQPALCETGIPDGVGYTLVGTADELAAMGWVDEADLSFGVTYCYRVVTRYADGALSLASEEACGRIKKDIPVMTRASVTSTGPLDSVLVGWSPPTELDTAAFPGPYTYTLHGAPVDGTDGPKVALWSSETTTDLLDLDTLVTLGGLNTESFAWEFDVTLASAGVSVGLPPAASTPWLAFTPDDNELRLDIFQNAPWALEHYVVEREVPTGGDYMVLDTVATSFFVDTNLVNGETYCYRVTTLGRYDDPSTEAPLVNVSQEACGTPYDFTPPCALNLDVQPSCEHERDTLTWSRPEGCESDDIVAYRIRWAPFLGDSLEVWKDIEEVETLTDVFNEDNALGTIAGCFTVTALDSLMPGPDGNLRRNEGPALDTVCVDNCPFYFLPNVFSPNQDGTNDAFQAFPWKFIDSVDVRIHSRWGELVFQTGDPDVGWDGTHMATGEAVSDGVYTCTVTAFTRRLEGIVPERFVQELHVVSGTGATTD